MKLYNKTLYLPAILLICFIITSCNSNQEALLSTESVNQQNQSNEPTSLSQDSSEGNTIIYEDLDIEELESLANDGDVKAQFQLGYSYDYGKKVERDGQKAIEWYSKAAEQNHIYAQYNLGTMYYNGGGVDQDFQKAFEWYTKAAEQGDSDAQYNIGEMYYDGRGAEKNTEEAIKWLTKAADQDNEEAKELLKEIESSESDT